ncbi:MAG: capsular biosynthesis protein [Bacteroidetes bacterium]|nr:capsular biosynthesis protein [Bacteroidota bacterium]
MGLLSSIFGSKTEGGHGDSAAYKPLYDWLGTDMHNHVLPGIDDGSPDVETSLEFLRRYHKLGFRQVVASPHMRFPQFENSNDKIRAAYELLENAPGRNEIPVKLAYSAEYYLDERFLELLERDMLLPFGGNYILTELSLGHRSFLDLDQVAQRMFDKGLRPILAHPERYLYWSKSMETFQKLKSRGWLLQINLMSVLGYYGKVEQRTANYLLDEDIVDFVGTDIHKEKHFDVIAGIDDKILQKLKSKYLINNLFTI